MPTLGPRREEPPTNVVEATSGEEGSAPAALRTCQGPLLLLYINTAFLSADQNLLAPNLSQAAEEFAYNEVDRDVYLGGYVALFFFVVGAPASVFIGYLADRMHRLNLYVITVWIGEVACLLTAFIQKGSLWQLLLCRAMTGVSVGGSMPLIFSILADMYPDSQRARVSMWVLMSFGAGIAGGQMLAGFVGSHMGWRFPFIIVAVPSLFMSIAVRLLVKEPARAGAEKRPVLGNNEYQEMITWRKVCAIFMVPTNILLMLQGVSGCIPWGVMFAFMNDFLAQDKGLSVATATICVLSFGAGCALGGLMGGFLGQRVYNCKPWLLPLVVQSGPRPSAAALGAHESMTEGHLGQS